MGPGEERRKQSKTMDVCVLSQSKANTDHSQTGTEQKDGGWGEWEWMVATGKYRGGPL